MAIGTQIEIQDRVSGALNRITANLYSTISAFEGVDRVSDQAFNPSIIQATAQELYSYDQRVTQLEADLVSANNRLEQLTEETRAARQQADSLGAVFSKIRNIVAVLGIGTFLATQASAAIDYASDLTEVQNVVDVVFGDNSVIDEWSQSTLEAFGLSELSAKRFAGTMGAMLESSGITGNAVEEMAMGITELAGDMASFYNLDAEEAFAKIRSGISGETEPLKQLGINMSVANLEAYALAQGISTAYNEMSQAEQTMLRYNYLMQATENAQGDFANTSDSFSNQVKLLKENWTAFTGSLATNVLPVLSWGISLFNDMISVLSGNSEHSEAFYNVLGVLSPLLAGVVGIMATYLAVTKGAAIAQAVLSAITGGFTAIQTFVSIGWGVLTGNTAAASAAQFTYNSALLACPLTWIIMLVIALIAVVYAVVAAINAATDSTISATGIIAGAVATLGAFLWNVIVGAINAIIQAVWSIFAEPFIGIIEWMMNAAMGGFDSWGGAVANLIGQIISWFLSLGKVVTNIIDAIFGTDWTSGLESLQNTVTAWGKSDNAISISREAPSLSDAGIDRWAYGDAWDSGYEFGEGVADKVSGVFDGSAFAVDTSEFDKYLEGAGGPAENLDTIADNTGAMAEEVDITNENLKYLRDSAEMEAINKFTTAEIKLDMVNNNNIASSMDIDGIVTQLSEGLREAMESAAEGVYA